MLASRSGTNGAGATTDFNAAGAVFAAVSSPLGCFGTLNGLGSCDGTCLGCGSADFGVVAAACVFGCDFSGTPAGAGGVTCRGAVVVALLGCVGVVSDDAMVDWASA